MPQEAEKNLNLNINKDKSRCQSFIETVKVLSGINENSKRGISSERISDTTEGRLLFLSGLSASLLFFLPDTSSFHNSERDTQRHIDTIYSACSVLYLVAHS